MGKLGDKAWEVGVQEDAGYRLMRRYQKKAAKTGADYDYKSAGEAGFFAPKGAHWPSRVPSGPKEGLILKSSRHPTFGKTVLSERKLGYHLMKKGDRIYSKQ